MSSTTAGAIIVIGIFLSICIILTALCDAIEHIKKLINSLDCLLRPILLIKTLIR